MSHLKARRHFSECEGVSIVARAIVSSRSTVKGVLINLLLLGCILFSHSSGAQSVYEGDNYDRFEGRVIQKVEIETYDPAGIRIYDTTIFNNSFIPHTLNLIHTQTRPRIISRILRFSAGDSVNAFCVYESERLIRRLLQVRDCFIRMKSLPGDTNQVSIIVVVQDRFSLVPNGTFGKDLWRAELRERNFLGRGHQMTFTATGGNQFNPRNALYFSYAMPILGKQLWQLAGDFCFQESSGFRNIQVSRPLLSPLFKWGGGAGYGIRYGLADPLSLPGSAPQIINLERTEAWLARAVALKFRHKRVSRQMIFSGSYNLARQHLNGSGPQIQGIEEKSESFLGSVGFTLLHRYRKKFMFSWEQVNDFTEGASIYLTNGWIDQGDKAHLYSGISVMLARQFNAGYFFLGGNVGIRSGRAVLPEQAAEARALYVAPLINLGKYRLRTALNGRMLQGGSNPFSTPLVTDGRSENAWQYNGRILQSLATSSVDLRLAIYTPWKPFGLNIAPFLYAGATQLRSWPQLGISSGWLPATGFGIILRHVKLAFNVVRLSFIYFPYSLSSDQPLYQLLPAGLFDLQTPDFEVPQPRTVTGI